LQLEPGRFRSNIVASFHVGLTASTRAFAVAAGALNPDNGETFRLLVVDTAASPWSLTTLQPIP
jgi:hypothetical protein